MRFAYVLLGLGMLSRFDISGGSPSTLDEPMGVSATFCSNGLPGVQYEDTVCCEAQCGTCGGANCDTHPGGSNACCVGIIRSNGEFCSTKMEAPCIIKAQELCSNGVEGVQNDDGICCEAQCGTCGGDGCDQRPGGEDACCASNILSNGEMCSTTKVAPCIIDEICSNGLAGVQYEDSVCCEAQCGTCGGADCNKHPGGSTACCVGIIRGNGEFCSTKMKAPCIIEDVYCDNGVVGVQYEDSTCCEAQCTACGGADCYKHPGGEDACCVGIITGSGVTCSTTKKAPCIIDEFCSNGVIGVQNEGNICCAAQCGTCGGDGCDRRPGGKDACCGSTILGNGEMCSTTKLAPCIIDGVAAEEM